MLYLLLAATVALTLVAGALPRPLARRLAASGAVLTLAGALLVLVRRGNWLPGHRPRPWRAP
jgi:hypothetical protein